MEIAHAYIVFGSPALLVAQQVPLAGPQETIFSRAHKKSMIPMGIFFLVHFIFPFTSSASVMIHQVWLRD